MNDQVATFEIKSNAYEFDEPSKDSLKSGDLMIGMNNGRYSNSRKVMEVGEKEFSYAVMTDDLGESKIYSMEYSELENYGHVLFLRETNNEGRTGLEVVAATNIFNEENNLLRANLIERSVQDSQHRRR